MLWISEQAPKQTRGHGNGALLTPLLTMTMYPLLHAFLYAGGALALENGLVSRRQSGLEYPE